MKYSKSLLISQKKNLNKDEFIFFWKPYKSKKLTKGCLSQWWESTFTDGKEKYICMEQYMMFQKAMLFKDNYVANKIMLTSNPKVIKELGRKVSNFNEELWNGNKQQIIINGNTLKFSQNDELRNFLINTDDKILVEASPYDKVWGIAMDESHIDAINPKKWNGENLLGLAIMEVRDILKDSTK